MPLKNYKKILLLILLLITSYSLRVTSFASTINDLKAKIDERNRQILEIQKEIDRYQGEIDKNVKEADSLKKQIKILETTKKKLISDISLTQKQIETAEFSIEQFGLQIQTKEGEIKDKLLALGEIIKEIKDSESTSLIELVLSQYNFSDFFGDLDKIENLQKQINVNLVELKDLKSALEEKQSAKEAQRENLENFKTKLIDQKQLVDINKTTKDKLFKETKNKESEYRKLLADRLAKQQALEDEIRNFEEQIRITIDPKSLPPAGTGILKWPLDSVVITQYFGNTVFANRNPQVYNGKGHNGVDFRASMGTPIKASLYGVVRAVGDTDTSCRGVSYGKWVLIDHPNNLSTLYAHFSLIKVSPGQRVVTGQIIGYSGDTGYTTGPHLHFGVFASKGVEIGQIQSKICGTMMRLPVASYNSYLNPLSYL